MKFSRKQPGDSGFKKTLDDLQLSLDFPISDSDKPAPYTDVHHQKVDIDKCCPKGHFLKTSGDDCLFCRNWLKQIKIGFSGVPQTYPTNYKRQDIGADYGGSGSLG